MQFRSSYLNGDGDHFTHGAIYSIILSCERFHLNHTTKMPRIRGRIRFGKDQGLKCQWHLPLSHPCVCLWLKMPESPWESPSDSSSRNRPAAVACLPGPSAETAQLLASLAMSLCSFNSLLWFVLLQTVLLPQSDSFLPISILLFLQQVPASLCSVQLCKLHLHTTLADMSLPFLI